MAACAAHGVASLVGTALPLRSAAAAREPVGTGPLSRPLSGRGGRIGLGGLGVSLGLCFALADGHAVSKAGGRAGPRA
jgi:hypothetical protein